MSAKRLRVFRGRSAFAERVFENSFELMKNSHMPTKATCTNTGSSARKLLSFTPSRKIALYSFERHLVQPVKQLARAL